MLSRDEAAATLKDIQKTQGRSFQAYGYQSAAPFLVLWGFIWLVGYGASDLLPRTANIVWPGLLVIGFIASWALGRRGQTNTGSAAQGLRIMAMWLVAAVYLSAVVAVMKPTSSDQIGALIPLLIALVYGVMGIWMGMRFLIAGAAIAALTLGGFFLLRDHFGLWMAFVGGGTLIATGFWLKKA